jgi:hypothetical protein
MGMGFHGLGRVWVGKTQPRWVGRPFYSTQPNPTQPIPFLKVDFDGWPMGNPSNEVYFEKKSLEEFIHWRCHYNMIYVIHYCLRFIVWSSGRVWRIHSLFYLFFLSLTTVCFFSLHWSRLYCVLYYLCCCHGLNSFNSFVRDKSISYTSTASGATRRRQLGNCPFYLEICPLKVLLVNFCPLKLYFFRIVYLFSN